MNLSSPIPRIILTLGLFAVTLAGCAPAASTPAPVDANAVMTQVASTISAASTQTALYTPPPSETPVPTATVPRTPPALPGAYTSSLLNPKDTPHTYITDSCQSLQMKWDSNNAAPGTVVMVIMIHGLAKGTAAKNMDMSIQDFKKLINDLKEMGFTAINTDQLVGFLYNNSKIPMRSVVLIQDDRRTAQNFNDVFRPYWDQWQWPVVNAWINANDSINTTYLPENIALENEGWVDHQAHGVVHNAPMSDQSSDEYIRGELQGSIDAMKENYNKTPAAIIWPGGGFGLRPVQVAREVGFKLGFTVNPRGPIMFNWVPLSDTDDPMRPSYKSEGAIGDPLMLLPRYWSTDARNHIDTVRIIGDEAAAYAQSVKTTELEYYDIMCVPTYGPIP